jgi:hypothetical protein
MLKGRSKPEDNAVANDDQQPQFKENAQVNARIDEYIKNNPKYWNYVQSMPRERMERALVLTEIQRQDRSQRMREGVMRKLNENPEMKQNVEAMVKNMPEDQRERATVSIARRIMQVTTPRQTQSSGMSV